jgi:hypothetical protein
MLPAQAPPWAVLLASVTETLALNPLQMNSWGRRPRGHGSYGRQQIGFRRGMFIQFTFATKIRDEGSVDRYGSPHTYSDGMEREPGGRGTFPQYIPKDTSEKSENWEVNAGAI